jgi:hypothetical protein
MRLIYIKTLDLGLILLDLGLVLLTLDQEKTSDTRC